MYLATECSEYLILRHAVREYGSYQIRTEVQYSAVATMNNHKIVHTHAPILIFRFCHDFYLIAGGTVEPVR